MKALILSMLVLSASGAQTSQPALTGKRRAEIAQNRVTQKVERKRTGKKGSTNEWETARSFPLMFDTKKGKGK